MLSAQWRLALSHFCFFPKEDANGFIKRKCCLPIGTASCALWSCPKQLVAKELSLHPGVWLLPELTQPKRLQKKANMSIVCVAIFLAQVQFSLYQPVLSM